MYPLSHNAFSDTSDPVPLTVGATSIAIASSPIVVAVATTKGGSGKSDVTSNLAVAAQEDGMRTAILDLDPQGTLVSWGDVRRRLRPGATPEVVAATPASLRPTLDAMTRGADVDIVFLDTPGRNGAEFEAALRACDFGLVVARPTTFDMPGARETVRFLRRLETRHAVVLNQVSLHPGRADEVRAIFEKVGYPTTPYVRALVAHQDAAAKGMGVTEFCPLAPAATEVRALWAYVKDKLAALRGTDA